MSGVGSKYILDISPHVAVSRQWAGGVRGHEGSLVTGPDAISYRVTVVVDGIICRAGRLS